MISRLRGPALLTLAAAVLEVAVAASPLAMDFFWRLLGRAPMLFVLPVIACLWSVIIGVRAAGRKEWRYVAAAAALPALIALGVVIDLPGRCEILGDRIHFELQRNSYQNLAAALPRTGEPRLAVFGRGGMVWYGEGVVYDEADEITRPPAERTPAWTERAKHTELGCGYWAEHLDGHFYYAGFWC